LNNEFVKHLQHHPEALAEIVSSLTTDYKQLKWIGSCMDPAQFLALGRGEVTV